ncbi:MAG: glutamine--fructose-6-phosphate transaminase (isomerizing) [Promethearchaeota archaeon]
MCGIIGYIGRKKAAPIIKKCLEKLEYRGYDSAGMITYANPSVKESKTVGSPQNLLVSHMVGNLGIGHTRWATHGSICRRNAHPHFSCGRKVSIVHNGIIENFQELKEELQTKGHIFSSDTDSEVIAHLIEEQLECNNDLLTATAEATKSLEGYYAFVAFSTSEPDTLVATRKENPLIVGIGKDETFISSDIYAILDHTKSIVEMNDGEIIKVNRDQIALFSSTLASLPITPTTVNWETETVSLGGYAHYTIKEIFEQSSTLPKTFDQDQALLQQIANEIADAELVIFTGMGTSLHAAQNGREWFLKDWKGKYPPLAIRAAELSTYKSFFTEETVFITISQSGETFDLMSPLRSLKKEIDFPIYSIVNKPASALGRMSTVIPMNAGVEIGVASTKAYVNTLSILAQLDMYRRQQNDLSELKENLTTKIRQVLLWNQYKTTELAQQLINEDSVYFIAREGSLPTASEGALKLKEISYLHAEALSSAELKHGTLALIKKNTPVIAVSSSNDTANKQLKDNVIECRSRGANVTAVAPEGTKIPYDYLLPIPSYKTEYEQAILQIVPLQLLAYHTANLLGCEIDKPRNLAKSVTVG